MSWSAVPTDEILGYLPTSAFLAMTDENLNRLSCYVGQRRNEGARGAEWNRVFTANPGQRVLDYGCGLGVEAIRFASGGIAVDVFDIQPGVAERVSRYARTFGLTLTAQHSVPTDGRYDLLYSNGVLHHIPDIDRLLQSLAVETLKPGGEILLGLYTDRAWRDVVDASPPMYGTDDQRCMVFGSRMEAPLSVYAEPWWADKIRKRWGFLEMMSYGEIGGYSHMAAVRLRPR